MVEENYIYGLSEGDVVQIEEGVFRRTEKGFHTGRARFLVWTDGTVTVDNTLTRGSRHPLGENTTGNLYYNLYVAETQWTEFDGAIWEVDVTFKGFFGWNTADGKPNSSGVGMGVNGYSRRIRTQAGEFSGENITSASGTGKHVIGDPHITVVYQYIQKSAALPDTEAVNTNLTPPDAPAVPELEWTYLADYVLRYPYGWVLEAREFDDIVDEAGNSLIYFVTDTYAYYQRYRPGDI